MDKRKRKFLTLLVDVFVVWIVGGVIGTLMQYSAAMVYNDRQTYPTPLLVGTLATFGRTRCPDPTLNIMFFIIEIYVSIKYVVSLEAALCPWSVSEYCKDDGDTCKCRFDDNLNTSVYVTTPFKTCAGYQRFTAVLIVLFIFIILSRVAEATEFVRATYFCYPSKMLNLGVFVPSWWSLKERRPVRMSQAYGQPRRVMRSQDYRQQGPDMMSQSYGQPGPDMMPQAYDQSRIDMLPQAYAQPLPDLIPQAYGQPGRQPIPDLIPSLFVCLSCSHGRRSVFSSYVVQYPKCTPCSITSNLVP